MSIMLRRLPCIIAAVAAAFLFAVWLSPTSMDRPVASPGPSDGIDPVATLERLDMRVRGVDKPYESFRWKLSLAQELAGETQEQIVVRLSQAVESLSREGRIAIPWLLLKDAVNGCESAGKGVGIGDFLDYYEHQRRLDQDHNEACAETEKLLKDIAARKRSGSGI